MPKLIEWLKIERSDLSKPSVVVLILANLVPLFGVIFLDWKVFPLMLLFWIENVIVGIFNVFKMLTCQPEKPEKWAAKAAAIPFFCVHYGMFTLVHGLFVFFMFGGMMDDDSFFPKPSTIVNAMGGFQIFWAVLALFLSHSVSFFMNFIGKGEFKKSSLNQLMSEPYTRVVILHLTIIFGGFLMMFLGSPIAGLILLIAIKTIVDIRAHLKQHNKTLPVTGKAAAIISQE
jgi:hypothetical protein